MKAIVLPDDLLRQLEKRFGAVVRRMDPWNSDRTFGYSGFPMAVAEKAAEALENPELMLAFFRLDRTPEEAVRLVELLEAFGPPLIERIVAAYRDRAPS
jgi:hypothetical protein